ncbi:MAG: DUF1553 domain-containing protein, partial [Planctomycetes bacterium]|nr:DUF1553 domain-containing protein [Planctomycetota bacterium]
GRFRLSAASTAGETKASELPVELEAVLAHDPTTWTDAEHKELKRHFLWVAPELAAAREPIERLRRTLPEFPNTMVFEERPADNPRKTFRHYRGEFLQPREDVSPGLPELFGLTEGGLAPADRLSFARWLASARNPLVGRVTVNRAWRDFFGHGLVRTNGDFGVQSPPPTHPELLDWLAVEFMAPSAEGGLGWSMKRLHRLFVTSAAYRQSSRVTPELLRQDPQNRLLARAPRLRVDAETVRDLVLAASSRLSRQVGGPSVYPPQPASVTALAYGEAEWPVSNGPDRYRRSLYTFSKRTAPFAAYAVFDAPTGETCTARRERSNTPLQALTLLNDEMFLELARGLAREALHDRNATPHERATIIFRRLLTRPPTHEELSMLLEFQRAQEQRLANGELDPEDIAADPRAGAAAASWMMLARALMNLDETVTRP